MRKISKSIILISFIGVFLIIGIRFTMLHTNGGRMVEIVIPNINGQSDTYIVNNYIEKEGCISFTDAFGFQHKTCGSYTINKY